LRKNFVKSLELNLVALEHDVEDLLLERQIGQLLSSELVSFVLEDGRSGEVVFGGKRRQLISVVFVVQSDEGNLVLFGFFGFNQLH
jgi:hypothetical protein